MNRFACTFVALGLAAAASSALAAEPAQSQSMMMTDAQMDNVTGGGLVVIVMDNLNNLAVNLNANVNATVNAVVNASVAHDQHHRQCEYCRRYRRPDARDADCCAHRPEKKWEWSQWARHLLAPTCRRAIGRLDPATQPHVRSVFMLRSACIVAALVAATASSAFAAPAKPEPVMMTDAQLDNVTAGDLTIVIANSFNNWNVNNLTFVVSIIANVNTAIANGGNAAAIQSVGTQSISLTLP